MVWKVGAREKEDHGLAEPYGWCHMRTEQQGQTGREVVSAPSVGHPGGQAAK